MVDRLHGEVPGHELDDGPEPRKARADADAGKAIFGDGRVDDAGRAELLEQALGHFVGALILGDLLAHDEDASVGPHLLGHGVAQRLAHGHGDHRGAGWNFSVPVEFLGRNVGPGRCLLDQWRLLSRRDGRRCLTAAIMASRSYFGYCGAFCRLSLERC